MCVVVGICVMVLLILVYQPTLRGWRFTFVKRRARTFAATLAPRCGPRNNYAIRYMNVRFITDKNAVH